MVLSKLSTWFGSGAGGLGAVATSNAPKPSALLRKRLDLRPVRNANVIEIRVYDDKADEAAKIANEIAETYRSRTAGSDPAGSRPDAFRVEIIDQATPALRPVRPNRPLNLGLAALAGVLFGIAAGAAGMTLLARKRQG